MLLIIVTWGIVLSRWWCHTPLIFRMAPVPLPPQFRKALGIYCLLASHHVHWRRLIEPPSRGGQYPISVSAGRQGDKLGGCGIQGLCQPLHLVWLWRRGNGRWEGRRGCRSWTLDVGPRAPSCGRGKLGALQWVVNVVDSRGGSCLLWRHRGGVLKIALCGGRVDCPGNWEGRGHVAKVWVLQVVCAHRFHVASSDC